MQDYFKENLELLNKKSPDTCSLLKNVVPERQYNIFPSKSGVLTLSAIYSDGISRLLHSKYDPIEEATRFIDSCFSNKNSNYILSGLGLGYHLNELIKKSSQNAKIIVIEKNPSIAHLALTHNDFSSIITHPGISFHIGIDPINLEQILYDERTNLAIHGYTPINFKPLINQESDYYTSIKEELTQVHQKFQIDINTQAAFSRKFYKNIFNNAQSIINSPGLKTLKNKFKEYPAIIVSAGPSLDKNISFIKSARTNIIILAVATALKPLLKNGIKPDFVVAVDPNEDTFQSFNIEAIPDDLYLIYDPCIPSSITSLFKGKSIAVDSKISLARWLFERSEDKETLGNVFSVAHSAFNISRIMGCNPIILVGQDLSFDGHRMHCTGSFYNQITQDEISAGRTLNMLEYNRYSKYSPSMTPAFNIFDKYSNTTKAMETYKIQFNNDIKGCARVLNATEGGVNIPGAENVSLREALHTHCQIDNKKKMACLINKPKPPIKNKSLSTAIIKQKDIFDQILCELKEIENKFLAKGDTLKKSEHFILRMEDIYKKILNDTITLHLMQGYDYLGFIEWNQRNRKIIEAEGKISRHDTLQQKLIRDRAFLSVLMKTTKYLSRGFECWLKLSI